MASAALNTDVAQLRSFLDQKNGPIASCPDHYTTQLYAPLKNGFEYNNQILQVIYLNLSEGQRKFISENFSSISKIIAITDGNEKDRGFSLYKGRPGLYTKEDLIFQQLRFSKQEYPEQGNAVTLLKKVAGVTEFLIKEKAYVKWDGTDDYAQADASHYAKPDGKSPSPQANPAPDNKSKDPYTKPKDDPYAKATHPYDQVTKPKK